MKRQALEVRNIYRAPAGKQAREIFSTLARAGTVKVEKIISRGHRSPPGFWYDQKFDELVFLLRGAAVLRFAGRRRLIRLKAGDCLLIPAGARHRVEQTRPGRPTIWLIVKAGKITPGRRTEKLE